MGDRTRIDWCDSSWNPVTGCSHGCAYCYARRIARRFSGGFECGLGRTHELIEPLKLKKDGKVMPYPFGFDPTFHRYKLEDPQKWRKPRTIFVCSMADLFGDWVPDEWIECVINACKAAPKHRYLFLTKNGRRYIDLAQKGILPQKDNFWYGCSVTRQDEPFFFSDRHNTFASIEPILEPFGWNPEIMRSDLPDWIIIGAETGNRKDKTVPERDWISGIVNECEKHQIPLFMKESLRNIMDNDFKQEYPW